MKKNNASLGKKTPNTDVHRAANSMKKKAHFRKKKQL